MRNFTCYKCGYYGISDIYAEVVYEGSSLLHAIKAAKRLGPSKYGYAVYDLDNVDEGIETGLNFEERMLCTAYLPKPGKCS